ncbi:MAG: substrate-binding domain-containing protein [Rhodobacteraceae bacterium]|nr:substrate-binding domain-containing protein [Paracoccaceae bacterium]
MMKTVFVKRLISAAAITATSILATSAFAGDVLLSASDGSISVSGELLSFEGGNYTIRTTLGEMVLSSDTVSCAGDSCPSLIIEPEKVAGVKISGSDTIGTGLMPLLMTGYASSLGGEIESVLTSNGELIWEVISDGGFGDSIGSFSVDSSATGAAFDDLLTGDSVIGMASRRIVRAEARALSQDGAGSMVAIEQEHIIAVDSLLTIVNPNNSIDTLSIRDIGRIYRGEVTNWSQLGGPDLRIVVYSRTESAGARNVFETRIFGEPLTNGVARIVDTNAAMASRILANEGAIGFVGFAFLNGAKALNIVSECGITSLPDAFAAKTEEYPLQSRLYLYSRIDTISDEARAFLNFAISSSADGVVSKAGYISLGVERIEQINAQNRMRQMINSTSDAFELSVMRELQVELLQWDRLSTTFRFSAGSDDLERKSMLDMIRLVEYLATLPAGADIALVGFTDSDGAFNANRNLSLNRAQVAQTALIDFAEGQTDHINFVNFGFGELAPAACNDSNSNKRINRRVEVWVRTLN